MLVFLHVFSFCIQCNCCIHCTDATESLVLLPKRDIFDAIEKTDATKEHNIADHSIYHEQIPEHYYHRKCYQYFKMKSSTPAIENESRKKSGCQLKISSNGLFGKNVWKCLEKIRTTLHYYLKIVLIITG